MLEQKISSEDLLKSSLESLLVFLPSDKLILRPSSRCVHPWKITYTEDVGCSPARKLVVTAVRVSL